MNESQKKFKTTEIQNLVDEAITNATERRKKGSEMSDLSLEELEGIQGGLSRPTMGRWVPCGIVCPDEF